jgi:hypothetical protein
MLRRLAKMVEIHTKISCRKCGGKYYAMRASNLPLEKHIHATTKCPHCGETNDYAYNFFIKEKRTWKFWKKHFIMEHFSKNEGSMNPEYFPRKCNCGKEILLIQERIM